MEMNPTEFRKKIKELNYPYNLLYKMLEYDVKLADEIYENQPIDFKASVEYILSWGITPREKEILKYRYEQGLSLNKIAEIIDRNKERVRQIEAKAFRKLRHPRKFRFFKYGVLGIIDSVEKEYKESLIQISKDYDIILDIVLNDKNDANKTPVTIEDLDLSVRSYNCLKRGNINYVIELTQKTREELLAIRNLGKHSLEEIEKKLNMYEFSLKESKEVEELI